MSIRFEADNRIFTIETLNSTYQMGVSDYNHLLHLYFGKKVTGDLKHLLCFYDRGFSPNPNDTLTDRTYSCDVLMQEYSSFGNGDFRTVAFIAEALDETSGIDLRYKSHEIKRGKYSIKGLPACYSNSDEENWETLSIVLVDVAKGIEVELLYGVYSAIDVITRSAIIRNVSGEGITIKKASSLMLDFPENDYEVIHFSGRYGMERNKQRSKLTQGNTVFSSRRGISSHQENPFFILCRKETNEEAGECYGFSLLYSGNFQNEIELDPYSQTRVCVGISDQQFSKKLEHGAEFCLPEAVMSYSDKGFENLSYNFHTLVRKNICRGKYKESRRPVLINNWEATYFDFNKDKLINIAKTAAELGIELFVLDDGWFGKRDSDNSGLGDWYVNEDKLNGTLKQTADGIKAFGMKFGLWIEPEMVSEDSDLFRTYPDFVFMIPGRPPVRSRNQLVLDFSRTEVVDYIFNMISKVIDDTGVNYLKIDMNRSVHEVYSATAGYQNRGVILHEYVLGVYDFHERLNKRYPDIMIEGCCGGGGRFDMGMLYYVPQIWCSDNTDACERLKIQHGTSYGYPMSTVGAHVSAVPNHQTGRITPLRTRGNVAMCGGFGYELDLNLISEEEKAEVKAQIETYKADWKTIQQGRYYRLTDPMEEMRFTAWEYVSEDKTEAILGLVMQAAEYNPAVPIIRFRGLIPEKKYEIKELGLSLYGDALMMAGIRIPPFMRCEHDSLLLHAVCR